jgi:FKBP-type peptidyl-prolyl cis-trans isomerase
LKGEWEIADELENYLYGPTKITHGDKMPGINEAIGMMKEGGKASFILPSDKANYDFIPLLYEIELIKVVRDQFEYEDSVRGAYADKYFGESSRYDTLNLWLRIDETSTETFGPTDTLYFNYTGRLVDGFGDSVQANRIFDSNAEKQPLKLIFGQAKVASGQFLTGNTLLKGLDMALDSIQNGVKASVLMDYDYAYGEEGLVHAVHRYIIVPQYQTVVYDIEVTQVKQGAGK